MNIKKKYLGSILVWSFLASFCSAQTTTLLAPMNTSWNKGMLDSTDSNVVARGLAPIYACKIQEMYHMPSLIKSLKNISQGFNENSIKAILLLGAYGTNPKYTDQITETLKEIREKAKNIIAQNDEMESRLSVAPAIEKACFMSLVRTRAPSVTKELKQLLETKQIGPIKTALESIVFGNREDMLPLILPFLSDTRDAMNIAPSGMKRYLRICDLVIQGVNILIQPEVTYKIEFGKRYTPEERAEFSKIVEHILEQQQKKHDAQISKEKNVK